MLYDRHIREALRARIIERYDGKPHLMVPEVDVRWSTPVRIDELLIADRVIGFEIKSDQDSVARLERQVRGYNPFVQRAYLVVGEKLRGHATPLLPSWWGVWVASQTPTGIHLREARPARRNPEFDPVMLTSYMSRKDIVPLLRDMGVVGVSNSSLDQLRFQLADLLGPRDTTRAAMSVMRTREDWRTKSKRMDGLLTHRLPASLAN